MRHCFKYGCERTPLQRRAEQVRQLIGRPFYLVIIVLVSATWIGWNIEAPPGSGLDFDPYPFPLLDGVLTFAALVTSAIVLIAQNRQAKIEQQHTHLDLQVSLLTEQKVSKVIHLLEELRADLPMVKDRHDPQTQAMQKQTDAREVLSVIEESGLIDDDPGTRHKT